MLKLRNLPAIPEVLERTRDGLKYFRRVLYQRSDNEHYGNLDPVGKVDPVPTCRHAGGMVRTQIQFEETQYEKIREIAHRERISIAEAVRRLIAQSLGGPTEAPRKRGIDVMLELAGQCHGDYSDLGENHDRYLEEDWAK